MFGNKEEKPVKDYSKYSNEDFLGEIGNLEEKLKKLKKSNRGNIFFSLLMAGFAFYAVHKSDDQVARATQATEYRLEQECNKNIIYAAEFANDKCEKDIKSTISSTVESTFYLGTQRCEEEKEELNNDWTKSMRKLANTLNGFHNSRYDSLMGDRNEIVNECNEALGQRDSSYFHLMTDRNNLFKILHSDNSKSDQGINFQDSVINVIEKKNYTVYEMHPSHFWNTGDPNQDSIKVSEPQPKNNFYQKVKSLFGFGNKK